MLNAIKTNPVRIYAIAVAALALVAFYVPGLPVVLILALVAAILGVGEGVRATVTPNARVAVDVRDVPVGYAVVGLPADLLPAPETLGMGEVEGP